jgi:fimbrial chaperone protein
MEATVGKKNRSLILATTALLVPGLAAAAGWNIDPVRIELTQKQQTAQLTITNDTDLPTSIQIEAFAWSQADGKDVYAASQEILVVPPLVTIAPKGSQVVRVALRRQPNSVSELAYRVKLQELPPPPRPDFAGVQVALRVGVPVFVQPQKGAVTPNVTWKVSRVSDHTLKVQALNQGQAHIQISEVALFAAGRAQPITREAAASYVLPGQAHTWLMKTSTPVKPGGGSLRLKANTDAENVDTEVQLAKP